MKAKTQFMKMYNKLPARARSTLIYNPYGDNPMSFQVCWLEINNNTELGIGILEDLGYIDTFKKGGK